MTGGASGLLAYALSSGADAAIIARVFAERVVGLNSARTVSPDIVARVDAMLRDWCRGGGSLSSSVQFARLGSDGLDITPDALGVDRTERATVAWSAIAEELTALGLSLHRRGDGGGSALLEAVGDVVVFELIDLNGKVLSEGKGWDEPSARASVFGEAIERLVAQTSQPGRLILATEAELRRSGVATPTLATSTSELYSAELPLEWLRAARRHGERGAMPAALAYYPFDSRTGIKAFSVQHTAGLAAGATVSAAAAAAIVECIETDAYWLSMRTHKVCARYDDLKNVQHERLRALSRKLADVGITVWAGSIAFDWPISVSHVVLQTETESLPALAHGLGSGSTPSRSLERALIEAVQVYSGLEKVALQYWPEIAVESPLRHEAALAWCDHRFVDRIIQPFQEAPVVPLDAPCASSSDLEWLRRWLEERAFDLWLAPIGERSGLSVVRAYIDGAASPFSERNGPSDRVMKACREFGLQQPYLDPVLI